METKAKEKNTKTSFGTSLILVSGYLTTKLSLVQTACVTLHGLYASIIVESVAESSAPVVL